MVSKIGVGALVFGALIIIAEWLLFFAPQAGSGMLMAFLTYLVIGGLLWLGLILILLGVLILLI